LGSGSCIEIRNSNPYFRLKNCTLYNAESSWWEAGIFLYNTENGELLINNCSKTNTHGIRIDYSENITVNQCVINDNDNRGITLFQSDNNIIIDSFINNSGSCGVNIETSALNTISNNNITNGSSEGIYLYGAHNNSISNNLLINNGNGIVLALSNYNNISFNILEDHTYSIAISSGNYSLIFNNNVKISSNIGIQLSTQCLDTIIYNNTLENNILNAYDDGSNNHWDNGIIGNYWDDYSGKDEDDNGIGDSPYSISGLAGSQDNYPIWDDGQDIWFLSSILIDDTNPVYNWSTTATANDWCNGSGTWLDPYIIKNVIINGQNSSSCIEIRNSNVYFNINKCTFYNSGSEWGDAGIKLQSVSKGLLINNNVSYNNYYGVFFWTSNNNTVSGNMVNNNGIYGIHLLNCDNNSVLGNNANDNSWIGISVYNSNNNTISGNTANSNGNYGLGFTASANNTVSRNSLNNNDFHGMSIVDSSYNTILGNNVNANDEHGIFLKESNYNTVIGNTAEGLQFHGIFLSLSNNNTILRNTANGNNLNGIYFLNSNNNTISGNTANNNNHYGIYLDTSNNTRIIGNLLNSNDNGKYFDYNGYFNIFLWNVGDRFSDPFIIDDSGSGDFTWEQAVNQLAWIYGSGTYSNPYIIEELIIDGKNSSSCIEIRNSNALFIIRDSIFTNSSTGFFSAGIKLYNVSNGQLLRNDCSFNNWDGFLLEYCDNNSILHSTFANNSLYGIYMLQNCDQNTIYNNSIYNNDVGIMLTDGSENWIKDNKIYDNSMMGLDITGSGVNDIINNTIINCHSGIYAINCNFLNISLNKIRMNTQEGIWIRGNNHTIRENLFQFNNVGLRVNMGNNTDILSNEFTNNNNYGIHLWKSNTTSIIGNIFNENNVAWSIDENCIGIELLWNLNNQFTDPIIIDDFGGGNFTWSEASSQLAWCSGSGTWSDPYVIENVTIEGQGSGSCIEIRNSDAYFIIQDCSLFTSGYSYDTDGIYLYTVDNGKIINNNCSENNYAGIHLLFSNNNTLSGNTASYNDDAGIYLANSDNNTLSGNTASYNDDAGIYLAGSNNNTLSGNTVSNSALYGIYVMMGNDNFIYNNIFINNAPNAENFDGIDNHWDNGTIGNYWDDYSGKDQDDDGVGDTPYLISGTAGSQDNFPIWNDGIEESLILNPFIIDDIGGGNYTWAQAALNIWCNGFGTYENPYIIEKIVINGGAMGSCLIVRNSNVYFVILNCTFYNSGNGIYDAGVKLELVFNGRLINNNCSSNNGNGIVLNNSQNIIIEENSVNNNGRNGIFLLDSFNNFIVNNTNTISNNDNNGINLISSDYNTISENRINYNYIGINLSESNYNNITNNNLMDNIKPIEEINCEGNLVNNNLIHEYQPPLDIVFIIFITTILIITLTAGISSIYVLKIRKGDPEKTSLTRSEKKKRRIENSLQKKIAEIENFIQQNEIEKAIIELNKSKTIATNNDLNEIVEEIQAKINHCNNLSLNRINLVKRTILKLATKFTRLQIIDIAERSGIQDEAFLIKIIQEMIESKEIFAEYFIASKALAFNQQKNIDEIDMLMETYKEWEEVDMDKKVDIQQENESEITVKEEKVIFPTSKPGEIPEFNIFLSYSTLDSKHFQITKIVKELKKYPKIDNVLYWEADSGQDIVEYMEKTLSITNVFVLLCSENAKKSNAVSDEWHAAFQMRKKEKMKIIPVYDDEDLIPNLLMPLLNVKYTKDDFDGFIQKLHKEILR